MSLKTNSNLLKIYIALAGITILLLPFARAEGRVNEPSESDQQESPFIIGGKSVSKSGAIRDYVVAIYNTKERSLCSGSIIGKNLVVTAAHCLDGNAEDMLVLLDSNIENKKNLHSLKVSEIHAHPDYAKSSGYDIGYLKTSESFPAPFKAAHLLTQEATELVNGASVTLAGYGIDDGEGETGSGILRQVDVKIMNNHFSKTEVELDQSKGKGACHGDSGGPAFIKQGSTYKLWGVTSRGSSGCQKDSIYTKISPFKHWIHGHKKGKKNSEE